MALVKPHGKRRSLCRFFWKARRCRKSLRRPQNLKQLKISSRETADLVMMGIGAFTPLTGFMTKKDWKGVCDKFKMADGTFWPVPVTLSANAEFAGSLKKNEEITLVDEESGDDHGHHEGDREVRHDQGRQGTRVQADIHAPWTLPATRASRRSWASPIVTWPVR